MTKNENEPKTVKVKRTRKRLYEPIQEDKEKKLDDQDVVDKKETSKNIESSNSQSKLKKAEDIVRKYTAYSSAVSFFPSFTIDILLSTGLQLNMLRKLCNVYNIKFKTQLGKSSIASLIGGVHTGLIYKRLLKILPGSGTVFAVLGGLAASSAITYIIGNIFIKHFESGGTLLDFDPKFYSETAKKMYAEKQ